MANRPTDNNDVIVDAPAFLTLLDAALISSDTAVRSLAEKYVLAYVERSAVANGASADFAAGVKRIIGRRIDAQTEAPVTPESLDTPIVPEPVRP